MAGRGVADGGASGTVRNPEYYCTASVPENDDGRCHKYRIKGLSVCGDHGGSTPNSKAVVARGTIAQLAEKQGIVLPEVKPKDFGRVAAEVISWNLLQFGQLGSELEKLRLLHSPVEHAREYRDILDLLDQMGRTIATLTKAAAALPPIPEDPIELPPRQMVEQMLFGIRERLRGDGPSCGACGCSGACRTGGGDALSASVSDDDGPTATLLPMAPGDAADGSVVVDPDGGIL